MFKTAVEKDIQYVRGEDRIIINLWNYLIVKSALSTACFSFTSGAVWGGVSLSFSSCSLSSLSSAALSAARAFVVPASHTVQHLYR